MDAGCVVEVYCGLLPVQTPPGPRGGRSLITHPVVLRVIWFVLPAGCRWKDVPAGMNCSG